MPQLRWFYELYYRDRVGCVDAFNMIQQAYLHRQCDPKTIVLYFDYWIDLLAWGCHHVPDCCIINTDTYQNAIQQCERIIDEREVETKQQKEFMYFRKLYSAWETFLAEERSRNFSEYCQEVGLSYKAGKSYYYHQ